MKENSAQQKTEFQDQEYDFDYNKYLNILKRNLKFIFFTSSSITFAALIYTFTAKPIYKGSFEIIVESQNNLSNNKGFSLNDTFGANILSSAKDLQTQQLILQSPLVLEPIYNYVKDNDLEFKSKNIPNYKSWLGKYLNINFAEGTNILKISYENQSKSFILDVLNEISTRYKKYSKSDREKEINKTIEFLTTQQSIYKIKAKNSRKKLNLFTIQNGLGDIDGFIELDNVKVSKFSLDNNLSNNQLRKLIDVNKSSFRNGTSNANQRYLNQFELLQKYEAQYTDLSSRLKPESSFLGDLKIKIENLKLALKRPNEILLEFRELKTIASRDENVLDSIEDELVMMRLEKVKQQDPWKMISDPTIDSERVFPKRKNILFFTLLVSLIAASIISIIREIISGEIFEFNDIASKINTPHIDTLYTDNIDLSQKLMSSIIKKNQEQKFGIIQLKATKFSEEDNSEISKFLDTNKFNKINLFDDKSFKNYEKIIVMAESGKFTNYQILILNKIISIYPNKFLGWIFVKENL